MFTTAFCNKIMPMNRFPAGITNSESSYKHCYVFPNHCERLYGAIPLSTPLDGPGPPPPKGLLGASTPMAPSVYPLCMVPVPPRRAFLSLLLLWLPLSTPSVWSRFFPEGPSYRFYSHGSFCLLQWPPCFYPLDPRAIHGNYKFILT